MSHQISEYFSTDSEEQEQNTIDTNYLSERITQEFRNYERRITSLEQDNKFYKKYLIYLLIFIFSLFVLFGFYIFYTRHIYDENLQLHKEYAEVEIKRQLWNNNIERIQKFVFEYLEDQKIL